MTMAMAAAGRLRSCAFLAAALVLLAGCATAPQQQQASQDVVTPSDEPENRRRARIRLQLAGGYFEEGKTEVALDELKQVIAADPSFPDAYNLRGLIYMRLADPGQAEESFRRALQLNPRDANVQHNYAWLMCQSQRYPESIRMFEQALTNPLYAGRSKTYMAMGLCQARAGLRPEAEQSLARSYELDAGNPITGYNLSRLLYERGEFPRAQFYIRRINNSEYANAESLWLGIKVERSLGNRQAVEQLGTQLRNRFVQSREYMALERQAFDE